MQARGMLMIEHRLIERMIALMKRAIEQIETNKNIDPVFIDTAVDFIRMYADRTHHGKEENILFRDIIKKELSEKDRTMVDELVEEHLFGRRMTGRLVDANARYRNGDPAALTDIANVLQTLADFYPVHIIKEDKVFFPASKKYFSDEEDGLMVEEFREFDRKMIHEKYKSVVEALER